MPHYKIKIDKYGQIVGNNEKYQYELTLSGSFTYSGVSKVYTA